MLTSKSFTRNFVIGAPEANKYAKLAPRPTTLTDTGLTENYLYELLAKHLLDSGVLDIASLSARMALKGRIVEELLGQLRADKLLEVRGPAGDTHALRYTLSERGRNYAQEVLQKNGYRGPAPVPLDHYTTLVQTQSVHHHRITQGEMRAAFADVVIRPKLLDQLGAAMHSCKPLCIYGQAGTGKTFICRRLSRLLGEPVLIPHAIAIQDMEVRIFDQVVHQPVPRQNKQPHPIQGDDYDRRYVLCQRPSIITGGELTLDMLEIGYDPVSRLHHAPMQLKATNGIYLIDDLGRQRVEPLALFNRWIVPLESRQDYLSLASGKRFPVPFDVVLMFSTNLDPSEIADEAFLRRLGHKIRFTELTPNEYTAIWQQVCEDKKIVCNLSLVRYVLENLHGVYRIPLLACHPRDLIGMALDLAHYYATPDGLTPDLLTAAWHNYFVGTETVPTTTGSMDAATDKTALVKGQHDV